MLGKLIKYEFKATGKFMGLMYGVFIILSAMISIGIAANIDEVFASISQRFQLGGLIIGLFIALIVIMFVIMNVVVISGMYFYSIKRFKDNILGDEGYLMHTLPVKTRDHILSKCIVSVIWSVASLVVVTIGYFVLILGISETDIFKITAHVLSQIQWDNYLLTQISLISLEGIFCFIVMLVNIYLHIYASMAVGFSQNTQRVLKSIGVYILITIVANIFETVLATPLINWSSLQSNNFTNFHIIILSGIIINAVTSVAYYFLTQHFLDKKLNLQ